jgi:2-dehydro-3-deoxyphosphogluconate aldolase/(4S)-4-hydroxy-2-oxoglutarate aldolase
MSMEVKMTGLTEQIEEMGIVPVIKLEDAGKAAGLAKALCEGGLPCAEVTFRTAAARDGIQIMSETCPDMLVGAGTVLNCEQVDQAVEAGARFIVSPGLNPEVVKYCQEKGVPVFPGCATPTEVEQAIRLGLKVVKFFPAEASGGLKAVQAMGAPYGQMRFMPTGGINAQNICNYLAWDRILACGGTWMVPSGALEQGDFGEILRLTREAVHVMLGFELAHVGINCENGEAAKKTAQSFETLFGFEERENSASIFSASYIETLKAPYLGTNGHIAIRTNSPERAKAYLARKGTAFREDSAVYREDGRLQAIYLEKEIGGFAVHLVRK